MQLKRIVSFANIDVRLRFLAMERSLRATGCKLPLWVIPYDARLFELPPGAVWWRLPRILTWLTGLRVHPMMPKYQCLTIDGYQYVDADVCFLRDPESILAPHEGFITSCTHWRDQNHTVSSHSRSIMQQTTTVWHHRVFNAGQFACDRPLFTEEGLRDTASAPENADTCLGNTKWFTTDQAGLNLLVFRSGVPVRNLLLPPVSMESTWAGDYGEAYERYWSDEKRKPYLIHWAGLPMHVPRPINEIFYSFLTRAERREWDEQVHATVRRENRLVERLPRVARRVKRAGIRFVRDVVSP